LGGCEDFRKIAWVDWDSICLPRVYGGLGVRKLRKFNIVLLGKWCWRMLLDKCGLWYRVHRARYGEVGGRFQEGGVLVPCGGARSQAFVVEWGWG